MLQSINDLSTANGHSAILSTPDYVTDCVIVGTGPSGGSLASFLGSYGK
jgi:hypothetical protein